MKYLMKAFKHAFKHYKWSIIASIICSTFVGVLWGANIGAVYPFAEVVFRGQNLHQWVEKETETANEAIKKGEARIAELQAEDPQKNKRQIVIEEQMITSWNSRLANVNSVKPTIDSYAPESPFVTLLYLVGILVLGTALKCIFLALSMGLVARVAYRTTQDFKIKYFAKILDSRLGIVAGADTGDTTARMGGDIGAIGGAIRVLLGKSLREPLKMMSCLVGAAFINWRLLLLSFLICPLAAFMLVKLAKSIKALSLQVMQVNGLMMGFFIQVMQGYYVVKAFGNEEQEKQKFKDKTDEVYRQQMKMEIFGSLTRTNNELLGVGMVCLSLIAGGYLVLNQETHIFGIQLADKPMDFGSIMTFYAFLIAAADPIRKLGDVFGSIQTGIAGAERVFPSFDAEPIIKDPSSPVELPHGDIELSSVSFSYNVRVPVLQSTQLTIKQGERVAIVGPNGCGKSTIINLLLRFYDPAEGQVTIGGVDIREVKQSDLRSRIGLVTQNTTLFNDSILENIRYGNLDATDEEVYKAGALANIDQFVDSHTTGGYLTFCGEQGGNLSGGQRQRIAIARAILRKPDIFIFDEATSQIDLESERMIHDSFDECVGDKTAIIITHRPAALALVDRIVVMNHGQVEATGTHQQLLKTCQTYNELYREESIKERTAA